MAEIKNLNSMLRKMEQLERLSKRENNGNVIVGYSASYALYVHENIEMKLQGKPRAKPHKGFYWDPQGRAQAKFLEQPARELQGELADEVLRAVARGSSLMKALMVAGLRLQRESQKLVPVDTGNLKGSAFTEYA